MAYAQLSQDNEEQMPLVFSPINLRTRMLGGTDELGLYVSGVATYPHSIDEKHIWTSAREFTCGVKDSARPDHAMISARSVRAVMQATKAVDVAAGIWAQAFGAELLVTNLGQLAIPYSYGSLELVNVWGPAVSMGLRNEQTLGVVSVHDKVGILHTSFEPISGFLDSIAELLERMAA